MKRIYNFLNSFVFSVKISYLASKRYFFMRLFLVVSTTVFPIVNIWVWKEIINNIIYRKEQVVHFLFMYLILKGVMYLFERMEEYVNNRYADELQFFIEGEMISRTASVDMSFFDSAALGDKVRRVRGDFSAVTESTWTAFSILSETINVISLFFILFTFKWWGALLVVTALIPAFLVKRKEAGQYVLLEHKLIRNLRKKEYYSEMLVNANSLLEIKLNNTGDFFVNKFNEQWDIIFGIQKQAKEKYVKRSILTEVIALLPESIIFFLCIKKVLIKHFGVGDVQFYLSVVERLREQAIQLFSEISSFLSNIDRIYEVREFLEIKSVCEKKSGLEPSPNPRIEFVNVSFCYPGTDNYVLNGCTFSIQSGERIGLLGGNGAGKTTIVKLLLGLYEPSGGQILLDGIDLKEYDISKVRKLFGVVFQDYVSYCLPLREIIAFPDFTDKKNDKRLEEACERSGFAKVISEWKDGYDSVIGRFYADNGRDLSGGEWQLLGMARSYFADRTIMILDEPSASVDPIQEDRMFEELYKLQGGKTSLTISHRLSNTILADKLIILKDGKVLEEGSHKQLMRKNGEYARLFNIQAQRYT